MNKQRQHGQRSTRGGRSAGFRERFPVLYAARHVVPPVLRALVPLLGLGAAAAGLLAWFDWSWLQELAATARALLADMGLPFFDRPDPAPWFVDTPWFARIKWTVRQAKWIVPILLALLIATQEVLRHRRSKSS